MNYTYILKCNDDTLYTGWTNNLEKRIKDHNDGKGAKYTKSHQAQKVEAVWQSREKSLAKEEAMKREYAIKQLTREEKKTLIEKHPLD